MKKGLWLTLLIGMVFMLAGCGKSNEEWDREAVRIIQEQHLIEDRDFMNALVIIEKRENTKPRIYKGEFFDAYLASMAYIERRLQNAAPEYSKNGKIESKLFMQIMRSCGISSYQFKD